MAKPKKPDKLVTISAKIEPIVLFHLRNLARENQITISELIRRNLAIPN